MNYLTADFGSTYTKLTAIDASKSCIIGSSTAFTTIETNVMNGFNAAFASLEHQIGKFEYDEALFCSSAAGGLKMVALGLVPELTAKAAKTAANSAGAKVVKTYSFEISKTEEEEIYQINPDLVLLCGGTDGGNKEVITANARRLCGIRRNFSIISAGNKSASHELEDIFSASDKDWVITENVMPEFNKLNIGPAKEKIKELFISKIIDAKGLSNAQKISRFRIIPTPLAVLNGCELLSKGTKTEAGIGDLLAIDIGGATTDVYSMSSGAPTIDNAMVKGLPEPYSKRTVEGDLGMRYSLTSLTEELDLENLSLELNIEKEQLTEWINTCVLNPDTLAKKNSQQQRIEEILARNAIKIAVERHCGIYQTAFTPFGEVYTLTGKDLTAAPYVIGIGGVIVHSEHPRYMLEGAKADADYTHAKPKNPTYLLDKKYIFASMGLLSAIDADLALKIMKEEIILAP